ncbi:glycosyltransferase [Candidatus Nomurabacteria bacterium]|nr:glycosyltransferase [Candidatus Nomurabacteria bacterium]
MIKRLLTPEQNYNYWLKKYEDRLISDFVLGTTLEYQPKISLITPVYNVPTKLLKDAVRSVQKQTYTNWQLCLHNDASTENLQNIKYMQNLSGKDDRIRFSSSNINENISGASNKALELADGEYFVILDNDDMLHPRALELLVRKLNSDRKLRYIYTDEDKMEMDGGRCEPIIKPGWSPHYIMSMMYTTHISLFETDLVKNLGGFRKGYESAQDYDLVLRYVEKIEPDEIAHIPIPLYHWRKIPGSTAVDYDAKGNARISAKKALIDTVKRRGLDAEVLDGLTKPSFRIKYRIKGEPLISIIIPTHNQYQVLKTCIDSIVTKTKYTNYEIIVINNNSDETDSIRYLAGLDKNKKVSGGDMQLHSLLQQLSHPHCVENATTKIFRKLS